MGTLPLPRWPLGSGDIERGRSELGLEEELEEDLPGGLDGLESLSGRREGDSVEGSPLAGRLVGKKVWLFR